MLNVTRKAAYEGITEAEVQVGYQITIRVEGFGTFTASQFFLVRTRSVCQQAA